MIPLRRINKMYHFFFLSFFLIWGDTRSLRMPALKPASQAGPMRNPRKGSVARHHQANLMVCVVCSCCASSPYREVCRAKGGIRNGQTLCHDIYPARPTTTVSLATNITRPLKQALFRATHHAQSTEEKILYELSMC